MPGFTRVVTAAAVVLFAGSTFGCGGDEVKYEPKPAPSGAKASLPAVPNVPKKPIKVGDKYTIWGASFSLRSRVRQKDVAGKKISLVGYITKTNLPEAPECAVHKTGKADPEGCSPPVPAFWIADTKDADESHSIKVMGFARNFAVLYDAIEEYGKKGRKEDEEWMLDPVWNVKIPEPIVAKGAKVEVTGTYNTTFTGSTKGAEADPIMGILTYEDMKYLEKPPEPGTLPGMD